MSNSLPKLHNAMWPGLVGKGSADAEPFISLDRMLELTSQASVNGQKFDGVDLFLFDPHINIDLSDDEVKEYNVFKEGDESDAEVDEDEDDDQIIQVIGSTNA